MFRHPAWANRLPDLQNLGQQEIFTVLNGNPVVPMSNPVGPPCHNLLLPQVCVHGGDQHGHAHHQDHELCPEAGGRRPRLPLPRRRQDQPALRKDIRHSGNG